MKARYVRVSTPDQNYERQLSQNHPDEKLFIDVCSGVIPFQEREQGKALLEEVNLEFLVVKSIDRLGRNLLDILGTLNILEKRGVLVRVDDLGIESIANGKPSDAFKMIISVLANISEMERKSMLERQREGIEIAKAKGKFKGRVRGTAESQKDFLSKYPKVVKALKSEKMSLRNIAKIHDLSLGTVQKVKKAIRITTDTQSEKVIQSKLDEIFGEQNTIEEERANDFVREYCKPYVDLETGQVFYVNAPKQE